MKKNDLVQDAIVCCAFYASALRCITVEMNNAAMSNALKIAPPSMLRGGIAGGIGGGADISTPDHYIIKK